jgi:hypothetical protein
LPGEAVQDAARGAFDFAFQIGDFLFQFGNSISDFVAWVRHWVPPVPF